MLFEAAIEAVWLGYRSTSKVWKTLKIDVAEYPTLDSKVAVGYDVINGKVAIRFHFTYI